MNEAGRLCQAVAVRIEAGGDPRRLRANLARILAGDPAGEAVLWVEEVAEGADSRAAAERRERELRRPVDPHLGLGVRAVLLRYADGLADLILVGHRATVGSLEPLVRAALVRPSRAALRGGAALDRLAEALRRIDGAPAPDWGLGAPEAGVSFARHVFELPAPEGERARLKVTLPAALGLVLARYTGQQRVTLGGPDALRASTLRVDVEDTIGGYLSAVREALAGVAEPAEPALVGLVTTEAMGGLATRAVKTGPLEARPFLAPVHPLSIHVAQDGGPVLRGTCWYRLRAFDRRIVEQLARHLVSAHRNLVAAGPDQPLAEVDVFDAQERGRLATLGGLGRRLPERPDCIHRVVAARAAETPDAVAVCYERERLTYRQLDQRANRAARALRAAGVAPGARVGVCLERSLDLVVVLLGVLKAGAAYVPLDPAYPVDRLAFTTQDADLAAVVTALEAFPRLPGVRVLAPESLARGSTPATAPPDEGTPEDPAYVIYTSGSTGRPKGVVVPHRNVISLLAATREDFGLGPRDVWSLFHSAAFDFSVWEIWGCLMTGGRLVVVPYWVSRSPEEFARLLGAEQVSVLNQTPSAFTQLMEVDREQRLSGSVRLIVFGGEPLDTRPLLAWFDRHPEQECRLVNMFGITETTVHVTAETLTRGEALAASRSVGRPLPGWHVYVRDPQGRLVPPGVSGEIYVGGAGVARHNLNRPELTAQRFLRDPFTAGPMYRSGDRGRLLPDGRLEHLGRLDNQVKLRGHRIELDEIRARLLDAPGVAAGAVVLRQPGGDSASARLDAYVVFRGGQGDPEAVRRHAARFLPQYMVPATVTALPSLPLTSNGKADTARLPEPVLQPTPGDGPAGDGTVEGAVRAAWESVFGVRVGPDDDFFSLGGNSLLVVRLSAALRAAGLPRIALREIYLNPTVSRLAAVFDEAVTGRKEAA